MQKGSRYIKVSQKTKSPHSINTEVWLSDYFWPFFANYSYEEIILSVLHTLETQTPDLAAANVEQFIVLFQLNGRVDLVRTGSNYAS